MTEQARRSAASRYAKALGDLRLARRRYVEAKVSMEPVRRQPQVWMSEQEPPDWTAEQAKAVLTYANAWAWFVQAHQEWSELHRESDSA